MRRRKKSLRAALSSACCCFALCRLLKYSWFAGLLRHIGMPLSSPRSRAHCILPREAGKKQRGGKGAVFDVSPAMTTKR